MPSDSTPKPFSSEATNLGEIIDLVKTYAKQETLGPLRGAGRWLAFGAAGAVCLGFGLSMLLLGLLRLLQNEWPTTFDGNWSWAPYAITLIAALGVMGMALLHVKKDSLQRKDDR